MFNAPRNIRLLLMVATWITLTSCQTIIDAPVNTGVQLGDDARFNFSASFEGTNAVKWAFSSYMYPAQGEVDIYDSVTGVYPDYNGQIEVDTTEVNQYDLTVLDTLAEDSGIYIGTFALNQGSKAPAQLVVVEPMMCSPMGEEAVVDQDLIYSCQVTYHGYKAPTLAWRDEAGSAVSSYMEEDELDPYHLTLKANMTATPAQDMHVYTCHLSFMLDVDETDAVPLYTDHCTAHYSVLHHPTELILYPEYTGSTLTLDEGDHINCTSNGNPIPDYTWFCNGALYADGQAMEIGSDLAQGSSDLNTCNCTARNTVDGVYLGSSTAINFYAYATSDDSDADTA